MKNIAITEENRGKIEAEIERVQKNCRVRLISVDAIYDECEDMEALLSKRFYKKDTVGMRFLVDYSPVVGMSYDGVPEATQFTIKKTRSGWTLESIERARQIEHRAGFVFLNADAYADAAAKFALDPKNWRK